MPHKDHAAHYPEGEEGGPEAEPTKQACDVRSPPDLDREQECYECGCQKQERRLQERKWGSNDQSSACSDRKQESLERHCQKLERHRHSPPELDRGQKSHKSSLQESESRESDSDKEQDGHKREHRACCDHSSPYLDKEQEGHEHECQRQVSHGQSSPDSDSRRESYEYGCQKQELLGRHTSCSDRGKKLESQKHEIHHVLQSTILVGYLQSVLPDEIILKIFSYATEKDLCNLTRVCKRFNSIACDSKLWKSLYREVFEYDLPLFNPGPCVFQFKQPKESGYANPWKESFRQLYRGIHVYPRENQEESHPPHNRRDTPNHHFSSLRDAVSHAQQNHKSDVIPIIFVHTGEYDADETGEDVVISSDIAIIGAGRGNISEKVVLRKTKSMTTDTAITFADGARNAYLAYLSLRPVQYPPAVKEFVSIFLVAVRSKNSPVNPTIEHCRIGGPSKFYQYGVYVSGGIANPTVRNCRIANCDYGIYITDADGTYEGNAISDNNTGIGIDLSSNPVIRKNKVWAQNSEGVYFDSNGSGLLEQNEIHDNGVNVCIYDHTPRDATNLAIIRRNQISRGKDAGIYTSNGTGVIIEENEFSHNNGTDVRIIDNSHVVLRRNVFDGSNAVVLTESGSTTDMEDNQFSNQRLEK